MYAVVLGGLICVRVVLGGQTSFDSVVLGGSDINAVILGVILVNEMSILRHHIPYYCIRYYGNPV